MSIQFSGFVKLLFLAAWLAVMVARGQPYSVDHTPLLPDAKLTPGGVMTNVTVEQLCQKGYANVLHGGARNVSAKVHRQVFINYFGRVPDKPGLWEVDHLVIIEIGGDNSISNLWPQTYSTTTTWNARTKDKLENRLAKLVRDELKARGHDAATALLARLQAEVAANWTNAYTRYLGKP